MRKICAFMLALVLLIASTEAEVVWYYPFGITEESTEEQIIDVLCRTFSASYDPETQNYRITDQKIFDIPVTQLSYKNSRIEIMLSNAISSTGILHAYANLCDEYGEPQIYDVYEEVITLSGKERRPVEIRDYSTVGRAWDEHRLSGTVCWGNVSFEIASFIHVSDQTPVRYISINFALEEQALNYEVR